MTTHTLRPNGTVAIDAWALVGGGGTAHATLNDNSDATYVTDGANVATADLTLDLENVTSGMIPATAQVRSITPRYRVKQPAGNPNRYIGYLDLGGNTDAQDGFASIGTAFATLTGAARTVMPDGGVIFGRKTGAYAGIGALNSLQAVLHRRSDEADFAEHYLDVVVNEAPNSTRAPADVVTNATTTITSAREANFRADDVGKPITGAGIPVGATIATVTPAVAPSRASSATLSAAATASATITATIGVLTWITGPADPVTTTTKPTVTWTYTDPEGDVQERYWVKVYDAAVYGAPGFLPWGYTGPPGSSSVPTPGAVWDSGEVLSAATSVQVGVDLENGVTYRAFVRVADAGSGGRYNDNASYGTTSVQTYKQFTVTLTQPDPPTLVVTPQPTTARVKLDITADAGPPTTEYFIVERSDDGGTTWVTVRDGLELDNPASGTATQTIYDYEAPWDTSLLYRARSVDQGTGLDIASDWTTAGAVTLVMATDGSCHSWLKSYTDPSLNISFVHADTRFESKSSENMAVYETEGRADPIIHGGTIRSESMTITFKFDTDAQWRAFEALRALKEPLLFQSVFGDDGLEEYWVRLGPDRSVIRMSSGRMNTTQDRLVSVAAREVRRPTVV